MKLLLFLLLLSPLWLIGQDTLSFMIPPTIPADIINADITLQTEGGAAISFNYNGDILIDYKTVFSDTSRQIYNAVHYFLDKLSCPITYYVYSETFNTALIDELGSEMPPLKQVDGKPFHFGLDEIMPIITFFRIFEDATIVWSGCALDAVITDK